MTSDVETVIITREEYETLLEQQYWLDCLEQADVGNWDGYEYAYELFQGLKGIKYGD